MEEYFIWEWQDKKGWVSYDAATNQILETAFSAGSTGLKLDHGFFSGGPYLVDFKTMKQTNEKTKFVREIRRNPAVATTGVAQWVCLVKKKWEPYDAEPAKALEEAYTAGLSAATLRIDKCDYEVDFVEMKQKNKESGFVREVRRNVGLKSSLNPNALSPDSRKTTKSTHIRNSLMPRAVIKDIPKEKMEPCFGEITILLKGGKDLAEVSPLGSDPFVVITTDFSPFVDKSEWKFKTTNPVWNQQFVLPVSKYDRMGNVFFTVYNYNHLKKNNYLGRLDVPLYDIVTKGDIQGLLTLTYEARKKNKKQGEGQLDVRIQFIPKGTPQASTLNLNMILQNPDVQNHQHMAREATTKQPFLVPNTSSMLFRGILTNKGGNDPSTGGKQEATPDIAGKPVLDWTPTKEIVQFANPNVVEGKMSNYALGDMLGEGGFAVVKIGTNTKTNEKVAIKIIQKMIQADADAIALITREIQILHLVENTSCVSFIESRETNDSIYIVMEYVGGGDLLDAILDAQGFTEPQSAKAVRDILRGLDYLHNTGICHRDMKPENILYHPELDVWKIADFGCATLFNSTSPYMTEFEGTIQYMAPEILVGDKYTKSVDIWATGVITYVSLSACFPWEGKTDAEVQESIMSYRIKFYSPEFDNISPDAIGFILRLLEMNTDKRITLDAALNHPWMKNQNLPN